MPEIWGKRIAWPNACQHWEIRKALSIEGYASETLDKIINEFIEKHPTATPNDLSKEIDKQYYEYCVGWGAHFRLLFYKTSMPAENYRRISINFNMKIDDSLKIGAYVKSIAPEVTWLSKGMILSIEDACHAIFGIMENPLELGFSNDYGYFRMRSSINHSIDAKSFVSYDLDRLKKSSSSIDLYGIMDRYPSFLYNSFYCLSSSLSRQIFADNLSILCSLWVIGHEDAHNYSGHLYHFNEFHLGEQELIFNELISRNTDSKKSSLRRAAEMQADMCATMRAIDYCYDSEFLRIATDWVSSDTKEQIWKGKRESEPLDAEQRLVLLRLISLSCVIPLSIYCINIQQEPLNKTDNYPSFFTRIINNLHNVAQRAISVMLNHPDHLTGEITLEEIYYFFYYDLSDSMEIYNHI